MHNNNKIGDVRDAHLLIPKYRMKIEIRTDFHSKMYLNGV